MIMLPSHSPNMSCMSVILVCVRSVTGFLMFPGGKETRERVYVWIEGMVERTYHVDFSCLHPIYVSMVILVVEWLIDEKPLRQVDGHGPFHFWILFHIVLVCHCACARYMHVMPFSVCMFCMASA